VRYFYLNVHFEIYLKVWCKMIFICSLFLKFNFEKKYIMVNKV